MDIFSIMKKDRYECNLKELEKKYKINKNISNILLIPCMLFLSGSFYFIFFESNIFLSIIGGILMLFIFFFQIIVYYISNLDDKILGLFLYIKKEGEK